MREHILKVLRQKQQQMPAMATSKEDNDVALDPELLNPMRNLGLFVDVEQMLQKMDFVSYHPLPSLEGLSIKTRYFVCPKDAAQGQVGL
jgi:hypothetical protein